MFSEIECGVCYRTYNAARRCPRELHCKHAFCERCLRAMSRQPTPAGADRCIACPLCRHVTALSARGSVKSELRVDESALERLVTAGVLDREEDPEDEAEEEEEDGEAPECEGEVPETEAEENDSSAGRRGGRFWKKVWRKISGKSARRRQDECMTNTELRSLAMMASYMF